MLLQLATLVLLAQPADDAPVVQRPGQKQTTPEPEAPTQAPPEATQPSAPAPAPTPTPQPEPQRPAGSPTPAPAQPATPAVVPLGEPDPEPQPVLKPTLAPAEPLAVPGPPPNRPHIDEDPVEKPRGPGTGMIAAGSVVAAVGLGFMSAALASDEFAPRPWQRAIIVPLSLGALSGGSAVLILGIRRHVMTKRWEQSASARILFSPAPGGGSVRIVGRF